MKEQKDQKDKPRRGLPMPLLIVGLFVAVYGFVGAINGIREFGMVFPLNLGALLTALFIVYWCKRIYEEKNAIDGEHNE